MPAMITFRSVVDPSDCDFLGHMNVSRYFKACSDGVFAFQNGLGLTPEDMRTGRKLSFAVVNVESQFHSELLPGDVIYLSTEVLEIGTKSMTFRNRLYKADGDTLTFQAIFKAALMSLEKRSAEPVPDEIRIMAQKFMAASA